MPNHATDSAKKTTPKNLNRQVGMYSLAAAVAGVSMLALAEPVSGEVIVTKKSIPIPVGTNPEPVYLSLANNGVSDFSFKLFQDDPGRTLVMEGVDKANDRAMMGGDWDPYALALAQGAKIGPNSNFWYDGLVELSASSGANKYCKGYWGSNLKNLFIGCGNPKDKFLGVHFLLNGKTHYGWVRLNIKTTSNPKGPELTATITEYAYETVANKAITAGSTSTAIADVHGAEDTQKQVAPSLGMLAAGADGLSLWRRQEPSIGE